MGKNLRRGFFIEDELLFISSPLNAFEAERFDDVLNEAEACCLVIYRLSCEPLSLAHHAWRNEWMKSSKQFIEEHRTKISYRRKRKKSHLLWLVMDDNFLMKWICNRRTMEKRQQMNDCLPVCLSSRSMSFDFFRANHQVNTCRSNESTDATEIS